MSCYDVEIYDESEVPPDMLARIKGAFVALAIDKSDYDFCQYLEIDGVRSAAYERTEDEDVTFCMEWNSDMELVQCEVARD
jgi:hypothetical protein